MPQIEMQFVILNPHEIPMNLLLYANSLAIEVALGVNTEEFTAVISRKNSPYRGAEHMHISIGYAEDVSQLEVKFWMERERLVGRPKMVGPTITTRINAGTIADEEKAKHDAESVIRTFKKREI